MSFRSVLLLQRSADLKEERSEKVLQRILRRPDAKIVIVESRPSELEYLSLILKSLDFQVSSAVELDPALKLVREQSPVLVLSSKELPPMEEYFLSRVQSESLADHPVPFIYVRSFEGSSRLKPRKGSEAAESADSQTVPCPPESEVDPPPGDARENTEAEEPFASNFGTEPPEKAPVGIAEAEDSSSSELSEERPTKTGESGDVEPMTDTEWSPLRIEEDLATADEILRGFRESDLSARETGPVVDDHFEEFSSSEAGRINDMLKKNDSPLEGEPGTDKDETPIEEGCRLSIEQTWEGSIFEERLREPLSDLDSSLIERIGDEEIESLSTGGVLHQEDEESPEGGLYGEARRYVLESIRAADRGRIPDLAKGEKLVERIISSVETEKQLLLAATDREQEFSINSHCVNTTILAVRVAETLGLSQWQQGRLALAALLHEIGVVRLPKQLVYKTEKASREEIKILRQRPLYSARCLKDVEAGYDWLSEVVGQVYERENGTGYPLGLTGREICDEAKIVGIADLFDACIHQRPYREALTGYQALFELTTDQARTFSDRIVKALIKSFSLFPFNEYVVLSSGEIGKVVDVNLENLSRPTVEMVCDSVGVLFQEPKIVDLSRSPTLYISKAIPPRAVPPQQ